MSVHVSIRDLINTLEEIGKLKQSERTRNFLKIFLIGFFLGRDNKNRIKTLTSKANKTFSLVLERKFTDVSKHSLYEKSHIFQDIKKMEEILK